MSFQSFQLLDESKGKLDFMHKIKVYKKDGILFHSFLTQAVG